MDKCESPWTLSSSGCFLVKVRNFSTENRVNIRLHLLELLRLSLVETLFLAFCVKVVCQ